MKSSLRGLSTIDPFIGGILAEVDKQFSEPQVCRDGKCPVTGSHNTDECGELISQAESDGR